MKIEHVALWTLDLERIREFYEKYFHAVAGEKYVNPAKGFESYFLSFPSGARLEVMTLSGLKPAAGAKDSATAGYAHLAISTGSEERVDALTARLNDDGFQVVDGPRRTGDGYYESRVLDPDGNSIEITV